MKKRKNEFIILCIIFLLAAFLRIYHLGENPVNFSASEARIGYNAYSLVKIGKFLLEADAYSKIYSLFAAPFIIILGLSIFSVRLVMMVLGLGWIFAIYKVTKWISKKSMLTYLPVYVFTFLLAISSWQIHFSRMLPEKFNFFNETIFTDLKLQTPFEYAYQYLQNFFSYFSYDFLFSKDSSYIRYGLGDLGVLYTFCLPFLLIGFYQLFNKKGGIKWFVSGLIIAIFALSAFNKYSPNARYSQFVVYPLNFIIALGISESYFWLKRHFGQFFVHTAIVFFSIIITYSLFLYFHLYNIHYFQKSASDSQAGYQEIMAYIKKNEKIYDAVVIVNQYGSPDIFTLFYLQYEPKVYQKEKQGKNFGKFYFVKNNWQKPENIGRTLYFTIPEEKPLNGKLLEEFKLTNNTPVFNAWEI